MEWSDADVPLVVAVVGVIAVAVGAGVSARSSLRVRLIEMEREEERDHRDFQIRTVAAVNALGTASAHLIRARLAVARNLRDEAHAQHATTGAPVSVKSHVDISPGEDARVAAATEGWRSILAEGHAFASTGTGDALQAFDERRAELVTAINVATVESNLADVIRGLEAADLMCEDLRSHYAKQIYRNLQVEKIAGSARVFQLAYVWRLGALTKGVARMHHTDIKEAQGLVARINVEHDKPV